MQTEVFADLQKFLRFPLAVLPIFESFLKYFHSMNCAIAQIQKTFAEVGGTPKGQHKTLSVGRTSQVDTKNAFCYRGGGGLRPVPAPHGHRLHRHRQSENDLLRPGLRLLLRNSTESQAF